ncbi:MAG: hypothetical protein ACXWT0_10650 [Methylobacter sp.]
MIVEEQEMPGNCDTIANWYTLESNRLYAAEQALSAAAANATQALAYLAAAETWAASCNLLIANLPAYAICEVPAVAAVAAAGYSVRYYQQQASEAQQACNEIQNAMNLLQQLLDNCVVAQSENNDSEIDNSILSAETIVVQADSISIPTVDGGPLEQAAQAVAEAETAVKQAQSVADEPGSPNA